MGDWQDISTAPREELIFMLQLTASELDMSIRFAAHTMRIAERNANATREAEGWMHDMQLRGMLGWREYHAQLVSLRASCPLPAPPSGG